MPDASQKAIIDLIKRSSRILILPSAPPDGDSLGSAIALYLALKKLDKEATVICSESVPDVLSFLPHIQIIGSKIASSNDFIITIDCRKNKISNVKHAIEDDRVNIIITSPDGKISENDISFNKGRVAYDLVITVDTAELIQLRDIYEQNVELFHQVPVVNIDHHISNAHFGRINYVDIMASATTELLFPLLVELGRAENKELMDEDIATLLLTGIITDTGSFQNANTTPKSFEVAADLIAHGARQQEIIQYIYKTKQLSQLKLWGRILSKIQTDEKHRMVWSTVSQQDFRDTGSQPDQTGDLIDELMANATGAEVIVLIKEKEKDYISGSIRTTTPAVDASKIAEEFGGGGHTQAAGFQMKGIDLRSAEYKIIEAVKKIQSQRLNLNNEAGVSQTRAPASASDSEHKTALPQEQTPPSIVQIPPRSSATSSISSSTQPISTQPSQVQETPLLTSTPNSQTSLQPPVIPLTPIQPKPKPKKKESEIKFNPKPAVSKTETAEENPPLTPGYKFED